MTDEIDKNQQSEETTSSTLFVLKSSKEDFFRIMSLLESGELSDLLGIEVLDLGTIVESQLIAQKKAIDVGQWLRSNFVEAIQEGWLAVEEVFATNRRNLAFRSPAVKRAKLIHLGEIIVALIISIEPATNREISTRLGVYPVGDRTYLPENLKLAIYESAEILVEVQAPLQSEGIMQDLFLLPGDRFRIELSLGDLEYGESFTLLE